MTRNQRAGLLAFAILACGMGDAPKPDTKPDDKQVVDSKPQKRTPATSINFNKELDLPFPTLRTLGTRVEAARRACDPVALAQSASELSVAEKVSEKKASLTSLELIKESADLAKVRNEVKELEAVYNTQSQITSDDVVLTDLKKQIGASKQRALKETQSVRGNQEPANQPRRLLLNNYSTQYIEIIIDGNPRFPIVPPGESRYFMIEQRVSPVVVTAYGDADTQSWGPRYLWGAYTIYTWNIQNE